MQSSNWKWHLDEVFVKINGERHYLWRAVDHEGEVIEEIVNLWSHVFACIKIPIVLSRFIRNGGRGCLFWHPIVLEEQWNGCGGVWP